MNEFEELREAISGDGIFQPASEDELKDRPDYDPEAGNEEDEGMDATEVIVEHVEEIFRRFWQGGVTNATLREELNQVNDESQDIDGTGLANAFRVMMELHPTQWRYFDIDALQQAFYVRIPVGRHPDEH